jgi:hypothetical protein
MSQHKAPGAGDSETVAGVTSEIGRQWQDFFDSRAGIWFAAVGTQPASWRRGHGMGG